MKYAPILFFGLLSTLGFAQSEEVESLKTIIKDTGAKERVDVKALEDCKAVMVE